MAHFAKLDSDNIVLAVHVVNNEDILDENGNESEALGVQFLQEVHGWALWKQTSYNTREGKHYDNATRELSADQSKALRKNYAGIGMRYDPILDAFIPPKKFDSWVIDESKGIYVAPIAYPTVTTYGVEGEYIITWDEANQRWLAQEEEAPFNSFIWNTSTLSWDNA